MQGCQQMSHVAYLVVQHNISSCCRADNLAVAWIPGSPNQFQGYAALLIHRMNQFRPKFIAHPGANR